jgi:hypothetical protein
MARRVSSGPRLANELKGRTLREVIDLGVSITFQCNACDRVAFWPWPYMRRERKLQRWMSKNVGDLANKLQCAACQSRDFYLRPFRPADQKPPPGA